MNEPKRFQKRIRDGIFGTDYLVADEVNLYKERFGDRCFVGPWVEVQNGVAIGNNVRVQSHSLICEGMQIGNDVFIGHGVMTANERYPKSGDVGWKCEPPRIGNCVSIGSNAVILPGVCIGDDAVIGAGALVSKDVPNGVVIVCRNEVLRSSQLDESPAAGGERRRVTFCFPYRGSGGVPMQFLRLSSALADRGWEVELVDYPDGTMAQNLLDARVRLVPYALEGTPIAKDTLLVLQTMTPWSIFPGLRVPPETHVLFWTCHPFNLVPTVPGLSRIMQRGPAVGRPMLKVLLPAHWSRLKTFLRLVSARRSIIFMDVGTARNTQEYLQETVNPVVFVPVPAPAVGTPAPASGESAGRRRALRTGWVGRLADFKYPILLHTMLRMDELAVGLNLELTLTVVGSGDYLPKLQDRAAALRKLKVVFAGERSPAEVVKFLRTELDMMFAMGTAALEAAAAGIPTILLDFTYNAVPRGYRYLWLHERAGYSLGELISAEHITTGDDELKSRLMEVLEDRVVLAEKARHYVRQNHALPAVVARLEPAMQVAALRWGDLVQQGLLKRGRIYSWYKAWRKK